MSSDWLFIVLHNVVLSYCAWYVKLLVFSPFRAINQWLFPYSVMFHSLLLFYLSSLLCVVWLTGESSSSDLYYSRLISFKCLLTDISLPMPIWVRLGLIPLPTCHMITSAGWFLKGHSRACNSYQMVLEDGGYLLHTLTYSTLLQSMKALVIPLSVRAESDPSVVKERPRWIDWTVEGGS